MQKNSPYKSKKQLFLAVPETCYQTSPLFSIANITVCFYRIKPTYQCNRILQRKPILYAPSFFALWALHFAVKNPTLFSSILCHGRQWTSPFALMWLKLRLQNERRFLGSDVPSLIIMKALHQYVAMSEYSALPIGRWLQLVKNYKKNCKNLSTPFFYLDNYNTNIHQIISKLQDEI
ncbi:hypothetical protein [Bartonella henselae]|uniref:hypothetical protein n=2 Tax=Bartonella henselae TaxID=38323 RepID=UPI0003DF88A3|nr:hypothetical protein [Bartonella henselae]ETS11344.1 hypothetical protein Q653_00265 [Bartonella henselae JK 42]ETS15349.1 hypothetical protein Q652_00397 [Bartonella henselae JK 41]KEC57232.1 hypothetical protein O97_01050 [Bartonella henselae str. Zeus]KEC59820.1 hypothetical protein O95_01139 [Bartonella henselae JK 53]MDM9982984.1 hypothetical protein [Bartonella henselae]